MYIPYTMKNGKIKTWKAKSRRIDVCSSSSFGRRYLVNLMTIELIKKVFGQVNVFIRFSSLVLLVVDKLFRCHLFVRLFSHLVSNHQTLSDQYITMLEHTKLVVADILRLLLEEKNVPVLIHCAHGKDRTGVIVAIILGCLEVDDKIIVDDYSKSEVR